MARRSLLEFTRYTKEDYVANWHHRSYAAMLDKFIAGKIKRLMVFMPPQHGKSELCSRRMPAKILGDNPNCRVAVVAYNHTFAAKFNRDVQRVIDSREYREIYPESSLNIKNIRSDASGTYLRNSDEFEIVGHRGSLISVGIGGGLTGNKVDIAIIDDPYKDPAQANSEAYRNTVVEWWDAVLETRLHNNSQVCLTFTRWRHDDIAGHLLALQKAGMNVDDWHIVSYEALKETPAPDQHDQRETGEALWPGQMTADRLEAVKARNPIMFEALYQQRPTPRGGNLIKDSYFFRFNAHELPPGPAHCYIDTATSEEELKGNDPTGILVYREYRGQIYLLAFYKGRWPMPELLEKIRYVHRMHLSGRASKIWIENKSNGRSTKQMLSEDKSMSIILENIKGKKLERLENELPTLEAGKVGLPVGEMWVDAFLTTCMGFPLVTHDEEVDCLTGAIRTGLGKVQGGLPRML